MDPIENVLARLKATPSGQNQWNATCPCRSDDDNPSLRVSIGKQNQVLMNCLRGGGCNLTQICDAIDLTVGDLFPKQPEPQQKSKLTLVDTYPYYNEHGELVMEVLRFVDTGGKKTFRQRKPDSNGGWNWTTSDLQKPLYRLPQVLQAKKENRPIYIVEGEKDVHALETLGKTATTNPGGAGAENQNKWTDHHTQTLAGANIIIITDNDQPGYTHAEHVHNQLTKAGCKVKMFKPGTYKDIAEAIENNQPLNETLIPYHTPTPQTTEPPHPEEPEEPAPLTTLIKNLQQLNPNTPHTTLTTKIQAHIDNYHTQTSHTPTDTGRLVEWTPFLEETTDLSYDWIIPDLLERQERVIVVAAEGAGKRLAVTTPIPTPTGFTKIGDIKVGDKVIDRFGNPVNVTYVSPTEHNPDAYRITFSDGTYVHCDAEHNWYTETLNEREKRNPGKVRTTAEIKNTLISNRSTKALNHAIPTTQPLQLPEANLPIDPYTLGAWLGDGISDSGGICTHINDKEIIERINQTYETRLRPSSLKEKKTPIWGILRLQTQLRDNNLLNNKHIPHQYLRSSHQQRLALLQGLMDTDGTIDNRGSAEFCVTNPTLAQGALELLLTLGIKATITQTDAKLYGRTVGTRYRIHFKTPQQIFHLPRKQQRLQPQKTRRPNYRYITKIEKIDPEPMLCISVDGPDNTYLCTEHFIPTHNTTLARQVALMTAAGIHPFRRTAIKPARTLMIDLENPERIIKRASKQIYNQIKHHNKHHNMDAHLLIKPDGINLLTPTDRTTIENHVAEIQPDILFIGPLYKAYIDPGHRTAEAISTEIARYLDHLRTTYNCALWIEHHAPLGSGGHRDLRPFGSAVWSRWSEFGIALTPDPTDPQLIEFKHYRGQREQREWPTICQKGTTWPFEAIEYNQPQTN